MATFDYITALRNRLLLLLERHAPLNADLGEGAKLRVGNRDRRGDTSRLGLGHKPTARQYADFPQLEVKARDTRDAAYSERVTFGDEAGDAGGDTPVDVTQTFEVVVTHEAANQDKNNAFDVEVQRAIRAGKAKLADPATPGSALAYVASWGPLVARRAEETVGGAERWVTRFEVPVRVTLYETEQDT